MLFPIVRTTLPDFFICKKAAIVIVGLFKEGQEHIHIQGLAKASGSGKEGDRNIFVQDLFNHHGLVNVIVFLASLAIIRNTYGQRKLANCFSGQDNSFFQRTQRNRLNCVGWYEPFFAISDDSRNPVLPTVARDHSLINLPQGCYFFYCAIFLHFALLLFCFQPNIGKLSYASELIILRYLNFNKRI